jgi:transcriptional regulator with PAS, ATPase and Fis domain
MSAARRRRDPRLTDFVRTRSAAMKPLLQTVEKLLAHDVSILLLGESGSGKDHLAEAIHACGPRRAKPMVRIDCASIPPDLFESELFGYEKGTFTDAAARKLGRLEMINGGSVYFDDVAALAGTLQAKLLRVIQEKRFTRLGGHQTVSFDARVMSSAAVPLDELLAGGGIRRDLFYRINVVTLNIPPLRDRREDIPALVKTFLARRKTIDDAAMRILLDHDWPGNVRELRNAIDRAVIVAGEEADVITPAALPPFTSDFVTAGARRQWTIEELESRYIREILRQTKSNFSRAAAVLGINRKTLLEKRRKYGIE